MRVAEDVSKDYGSDPLKILSVAARERLYGAALATDNKHTSPSVVTAGHEDTAPTAAHPRPPTARCRASRAPLVDVTSRWASLRYVTSLLENHEPRVGRGKGGVGWERDSDDLFCREVDRDRQQRVEEKGPTDRPIAGLTIGFRRRKFVVVVVFIC